MFVFGASWTILECTMCNCTEHVMWNPYQVPPVPLLYIACYMQTKSLSVSSVDPNTRKPYKKTSAKRECFIVFECLVPLMKHEKRVVYITSQTKTFHWLFNLLSANGHLFVFVFVNNGDKYCTSCFCRACRIYYRPWSSEHERRESN